MAIRYFNAENTYEKLHQWKSIDEISTEIQLAVICSEDQNFLIHNGFDVKAIEKALRGGSTISQQTAKNVFLWPQRSWLRKGMETWFTFLIETLWSKERILEVYLNSIEMGNGIYGVEAAAGYWFNKTAKNLNRDQAVAIAAILPNPRKYIASPVSIYIYTRKIWIEKQMQNYGPFSLNPKNK